MLQNRIYIIVAALIALSGLAAEQGSASEPTLTGEFLSAEEIHSLFSGNSITGVYRGTPYKQHNQEDGTAIVSQQGESIKRVPWFVQDHGDHGKYCEEWRPYGTFCYRVQMVDSEQQIIIYTRPDGSLSNPTTIHPGRIDLSH